MTRDRLVELLHYNRYTGEFRWRIKKSGIRYGHIAGYVNNYGYVCIRLDGKRYVAHRLAWMYEYGEFPSMCLDHKNGNPADNRISNLREATVSQNGANSKSRRYGLKGCHWDKVNKKWVAKLQKNGKSIHLGRFSSEQEAHIAYCSASKLYHGEFARSE